MKTILISAVVLLFALAAHSQAVYKAKTLSEFKRTGTEWKQTHEFKAFDTYIFKGGVSIVINDQVGTCFKIILSTEKVSDNHAIYDCDATIDSSTVNIRIQEYGNNTTFVYMLPDGETAYMYAMDMVWSAKE